MLKQWFLNILGCRNLEGMTGTQLVETRDAAKHTKLYETVPSNKESRGPKCPQNHCQKLCSCSKRTPKVSKLFTDKSLCYSMSLDQSQ